MEKTEIVIHENTLSSNIEDPRPKNIEEENKYSNDLDSNEEGNDQVIIFNEETSKLENIEKCLMKLVKIN